MRALRVRMYSRMPVKRPLFPALLILGVLVVPARAAAESISRSLAGLKLGSSPNKVRAAYPPKTGEELFRGDVRMEIDRKSSSKIPDDIDRILLGFRDGRLARVQVIYQREESKKKPLAKRVIEASLEYGEPRRSGLDYFWLDSRTVFVLFEAPVPIEGSRGVELRVSAEVLEREAFDARTE